MWLCLLYASARKIEISLCHLPAENSNPQTAHSVLNGHIVPISQEKSVSAFSSSLLFLLSGLFFFFVVVVVVVVFLAVSLLRCLICLIPHNHQHRRHHSLCSSSACPSLTPLSSLLQPQTRQTHSVAPTTHTTTQRFVEASSRV